MIRRRRPRKGIEFSFDSFLDLVTNVVGIIIRLILVVWVGARSYSSLQTVSRPAKANTTVSQEVGDLADPLQEELARHQQELARAQAQLLELGVEVRVGTALEGFDGAAVTLGCVYSGRQWQQRASTVVLVTSREPREELYRELVGEEPAGSAQNIQRIGDCRQPALIARAVYSGHRAARELDEGREAPTAGRDRSVIHGN